MWLTWASGVCQQPSNGCSIWRLLTILWTCHDQLLYTAWLDMYVQSCIHVYNRQAKFIFSNSHQIFLDISYHWLLYNVPQFGCKIKTTLSVTEQCNHTTNKIRVIQKIVVKAMTNFLSICASRTQFKFTFDASNFEISVSLMKALRKFQVQAAIVPFVIKWHNKRVAWLLQLTDLYAEASISVRCIKYKHICMSVEDTDNL